MSESVNNHLMTPSRIFQENRGKRWSQEEDTYLLHQVQFLSHSDIGKHLKRSENAVLSRLKKLAFHMIQNGQDPVTVQGNLKLSDESMEQLNSEFFVYPKKIVSQSKFIMPVKKISKRGYFNTPQQSQELQLLYEIRTMLRKLLYKDSEMKSPSRSLGTSPVLPSNSSIRFYDINLEDLERRSEEFAKLNE
jgi:hypothetical protein